MKSTFIEQLDDSVQRLILAVAEQKLVSEGMDDNKIDEALESVKSEKIVNVIDELINYTEDMTDWIDYHKRYGVPNV